MTIKKIAPAVEARGHNQKFPNTLYPSPAVKARPNQNRPVQQLLESEIVQIVVYLQNQHLSQSEKVLGRRIFRSTLQKCYAFQRRGVQLC